MAGAPEFGTERRRDGTLVVTVKYTRPDDTGLGGEWECNSWAGKLVEVPGGIVFLHPLSDRPLRVFAEGEWTMEKAVEELKRVWLASNRVG